MAREYKRSFKCYTAWSYQREIDDLNKKSQEGWQLIHGGLHRSKFKRNTGICYRYQIDYPGKIEDMGRYIETFREQGWEYINSTFNGWHYFRKPYDPTLPEDQYEIFTDQESLREMTGRWRKLAIVFVFIYSLLTILFSVDFLLTPKIPLLISAGIQLLAALYFLRGVVLMKHPEKAKKKRWEGLLFALFFLALLGGYLTANYFYAIRPDINSTYLSEYAAPISSQTEDALKWNTFDIAYCDNYYIDLTINAESPVCFTILDEAGKTVFETTGVSVQEEDIRLRLEKGVYSILFSDFAGGRLEVSFAIN